MQSLEWYKEQFLKMLTPPVYSKQDTIPDRQGRVKAKWLILRRAEKTREAE